MASMAEGRASDRASVSGYSGSSSSKSTADRGSKGTTSSAASKSASASKSSPSTASSKSGSMASGRAADRGSVAGYSGGLGVGSAGRSASGPATGTTPKGTTASSMAAGRAADRASVAGYAASPSPAAHSGSASRYAASPKASAPAAPGPLGVDQQKPGSLAQGRAIDRMTAYGPPNQSYAAGGKVNTAQSVVGAGKGYTDIKYAGGEVERVQGTRATRNNNPGNIEYGEFAKSMGAIGTDGRFAVFSTVEDGRKAKERLLFETPSYKGKTIAGAISRYAPPNENDTRRYAAEVAAAAGVSVDTPMSSLTPDQRQRALAAMERVEGFKGGTTVATSRPATGLGAGTTVATATPTPSARPATGLTPDMVAASAQRFAQQYLGKTQPQAAAPITSSRTVGTPPATPVQEDKIQTARLAPITNSRDVGTLKVAEAKDDKPKSSVESFMERYLGIKPGSTISNPAVSDRGGGTKATTPKPTQVAMADPVGTPESPASSSMPTFDPFQGDSTQRKTPAERFGGLGYRG